MSKNSANRGVGDHLKEGLKNIKTTYKNLYQSDHAQGEGKISRLGHTIKQNVKVIATGKVGNAELNDGKVSPGSRAKLLTLGTLSVTPVGPIAAFGDGIRKSVAQKKQAIKDNKPENVQKKHLEQGGVIKKNVPSMPPTPPRNKAPNNPPKVNAFANRPAPSPNLQGAPKNPMGNNRKPPNQK